MKVESTSSFPDQNSYKISCIEEALEISLYDWQKDYILGISDYVKSGRATGKTLAYVIRLCLSEGKPLDFRSYQVLKQYEDFYGSTSYHNWFKSFTHSIYSKLEKTDLPLRKISF